MNIDGVSTGIVLDHIQAGKGWEIYNLLGLDKLDCTVAIIQRVQSDKYGRKDIIKIDGDVDVDLDILGYFDTKITVNMIRDRELVKKVHLKLPEKLTGVLECRNPRCITSVEQEIDHVFKLTDRENRIYRCIYCVYKGKFNAFILNRIKHYTGRMTVRIREHYSSLIVHAVNKDDPILDSNIELRLGKEAYNIRNVSTSL